MVTLIGGVPPTNRLVTNTDVSRVRVGFDWVSFTIWEKSVQEVAEDVLCLPAEDFMRTELYMHGFRDSYAYTKSDGIVIATNGLAEQGVHVTITGTGCSFLFSCMTPRVFVHNVLTYHGRFSRVDLALDDYDSTWYTVPLLVKYLQNEELICHWKTYTIHQGGSICKKQHMQEALYLGSAKSDFSLKIYNKTLEQKQKISNIDVLQSLPEHWTRWEFCVRSKQAHKLMETIQIHDFKLGEVFVGLLSNNMRICKATEDTNRYRWPVRAKWKRFIGEIEPICLHVERSKPTIERKKEWLRNQVGPSLAAVLKTKDGFAYLLETAAQADGVLDGRMAKLVEAYNERVKDDTSVQNLVHKNCVPYVLELQDRCFLEGPPPEESACV